MEGLSQAIDRAVQSNDYGSISAVFSFGPSSWQSVGQGEQRSLAAHFVKAAVNTPGFLPNAFSSVQMINVMMEALGHLPSTVEGAADNKLRQMLFEYKVNEKGEYSAAARVLAGMRMEDDPNSVYYTSPADKCDGKWKPLFLPLCNMLLIFTRVTKPMSKLPNVFSRKMKLRNPIAPSPKLAVS